MPAATAPVAVMALMIVVVTSVLLSQFGTVRASAEPLDRRDEPAGGGAGELSGGWRAVRGQWSRGSNGLGVTAAGDRLSMAVRPVGGLDGIVSVSGLANVDGWSIVWRWKDAGTYGLVVFEPSEASASVVEVLANRTHLLATAPLLGEGSGAGVATVEMRGPIVRVFVDDELVVAGRSDELVSGASAGVSVVGAGTGASFERFVTRPLARASSRVIPSEGEGG